jgi:hypothetical protein
VVAKSIGVGGDYADIGLAWAFLDTIPALADDYYFTQISNFTENTGIPVGGDVSFGGHTVTFANPNRYTIINNGKGYHFRHHTTGLSNRLVLDGLIIKQTLAVISDTLIYAICFNSTHSISVEYKNLILIGFGSIGINIGIFPILGANQIKMYNCLIANFTTGIEVSHYNTTLKNIGYIENCSIYNCQIGINLHVGASNTTSTWHIEFKNIVAAGNSIKDFANTGTGSNAYNTVTNCADSDNSIASCGAILSNNIANIIPADEFKSLNYANIDFLKLKETADFIGNPLSVYVSDVVSINSTLSGTGQLYQAGTTNISAWNTEDLAGNQRPDSSGKVSIGAYEQTEISSYSWNLDDGKSSVSKNPSVFYEITGLKTISLTLTYHDGSTETITKTDYIEVKGYNLDFIGIPTQGPAKLKTKFYPLFTPL